MADVFLSYSSKDRPIAAAIERTLTAAGYDVFWDQETPTGRDWNSWIGEQLRGAHVVVVLWSKASVASRNVVHEATISVEQNKLIPAVVEDLKSTDYPMGFYTVQGADLRGYKGGDHPGMAKLVAAVEGKLGKRTAREPRPLTDADRPKGPPFLWIGLGGAAIAALAIGGFMLVGSKPTPTPIPSPSTAPVTQDGAALLGDWHWTGLACGQGPHITKDGDTLVITMTGTPTYRHAIDHTDANGLHTIVVEPESDRGQEYAFLSTGASMSVKNATSGQTDTWEKCP